MCYVEIDHANHYHNGAQVKIEVIITPRSSTELKGKLREVGRGTLKIKVTSRFNWRKRTWMSHLRRPEGKERSRAFKSVIFADNRSGDD